MLARGPADRAVCSRVPVGQLMSFPTLPGASEDSLVFERLHEQVYRDLGFELVEVPAGPLADRVALIRQTVSQLQAG